MIGWPRTIWIVRHAQSTGDVARDLAESSGADAIEILERDMDVPLSAAGEAQAVALGSRMSLLPQRPSIVLSSPQRRAVQTAAPIAALVEDVRDHEPVIDESRYPDEVTARSRVGKFITGRPAESWCDVVQRVRDVVNDLRRDYVDERVVVVTHQVVIASFRYVLERLTEAQVLALRADEVANASVMTYAYGARSRDGRGGMTLR